MSRVLRSSHHWKGFQAIRKLFVFGDSYSSTEYFYSSSIPNVQDPLGIPFPGWTYNEPDLPNWIGHLITKYCPEPRYVPYQDGMVKETTKEWQENPLLVYNFAKGGEDVRGVKRQIETQFMNVLGKPDTEKANWAKWTPEEALFVIWVGTNDCGRIFADDIEGFFRQYLVKLYEAGARNFLFIDVPPVYRAPAVMVTQQERVKEKIKYFDSKREQGIQEFLSTHENATILLFSSFVAMNIALDDPESYGMTEGDLKKQGGSVWMDHIHPTSKFHEHIAKSIAGFLSNIVPAAADVPEASKAEHLCNDMRLYK